jgi:bifunctional UDP-N-acetylglucosamine pyrophosphorylase/glucosamine-1-phosphate N-acetyltransferase
MENVSNIQPIILAAGKGTRMGNPDLPKVLFPLAGKPLIEHLLVSVEQLGLSLKPVVVVGFGRVQVEARLGDRAVYALQEQQLGTGHATLSARGGVTGGTVVVLYGDMPFVSTESLKKLLSEHESKKSTFSMFTVTVPNFDGRHAALGTYGRIIRAESGELEKIVEYKDASEEERGILEVNPGMYVFETEWLWPQLEQVKSENAQGEYYLTDVLEAAVRSGVRVRTVPLEPLQSLGINTPEQLAVAEDVLKEIL